MCITGQSEGKERLFFCVLNRTIVPDLGWPRVLVESTGFTLGWRPAVEGPLTAGNNGVGQAARRFFFKACEGCCGGIYIAVRMFCGRLGSSWRCRVHISTTPLTAIDRHLNAGRRFSSTTMCLVVAAATASMRAFWYQAARALVAS